MLFINRYMQTDNFRNSLTERIQSIIQISQIWKRANSQTLQNPDIKFPKLSRTYIDFQNFPGPWKGAENSRTFKNFPGGVRTLLV